MSDDQYDNMSPAELIAMRAKTRVRAIKRELVEASVVVQIDEAREGLAFDLIIDRFIGDGFEVIQGRDLGEKYALIKLQARRV